jgi:transmembrane protein
MSDIAIPRPIAWLLALPALEILARLALASPYFLSGIVKLFDLEGAMAEASGLGLYPPSLYAAAIVLTQLSGSFLFLTRRFCWLGAGILAVFTVLATLLAHSFWAFDGVERARQMITFFEHVAIVGGFAMAALFVNGRRLLS